MWRSYQLPFHHKKKLIEYYPIQPPSLDPQWSMLGMDYAKISDEYLARRVMDWRLMIDTMMGNNAQGIEFMHALVKIDRDAMARCASKGFDVNGLTGTGHRIMFEAIDVAKSGRVERVGALLDLGADIDARELVRSERGGSQVDLGIAPLTLAVFRQDVELFEALLAWGASDRVPFDGVDLLDWCEADRMQAMMSERVHDFCAHIDASALMKMGCMLMARRESGEIGASIAGGRLGKSDFKRI